MRTFKTTSPDRTFGSSKRLRMLFRALESSSPEYVSRALRRSARNFSFICALKILIKNTDHINIYIKNIYFLLIGVTIRNL